MCCHQNCKWPEEVAKICVDKHGMGHAADCEDCSFSNADLGRGVQDSFLISDAMCFAICLHLFMDELGGIVDSKQCELFATEFLSSCLHEEGKGLIVAFHEE